MKRLPIKLENLFTFDMVVGNNPLLFNFIIDAIESDLTLQRFSDITNFINYNKQTLNVDYFLNHSAEKELSPIMYKRVLYELDGSGYTIEDLYFGRIPFATLRNIILEIFGSAEDYDYTRIIINRFGMKWIKIYNALIAEYNPIENYSMTESTNTSIVDDINKTNSHSESGTTNKSSNGSNESTINSSGSSTNDTETGIYGFNSGNSSNRDNLSGKASDTLNRTENTDTEISETNTESKTLSGSNNEDNTREITEEHTRSGNIGVTTSQQMLESELKLREYDFYEMIFNDIDSILCLKTY